MPTKKRKIEPNLTYHLYSRCTEKRPLMRPNKMKELMIKVINMALEKYDFDMINFIIMDNHFHFFIRTVEDGATVSIVMQFIKSQYAKRYNKMMNRTGPFWNERYGDTIIEDSTDPEQAFHYINSYINNNPVKAKCTNDARKYKYGCINFFIDENYKPPVKLTFHKYFLKLGKSFQERARKFLEYEDRYRKRIFPETVFT